MKLIRFGAFAAEKPGLILPDGTRADASAFGADYDQAFFPNGGLVQLEQWFKKDAASAPRVPSSVGLGSPICRPCKIICIGLNFRDHAAESRMELPKEPVIFLKSSTALVGPNDPVRIPRNTTKLDWKVELAVVIGRKAAYVPRESDGFCCWLRIAQRLLRTQFSVGARWPTGEREERRHLRSTRPVSCDPVMRCPILASRECG